MDRVKGMTCTLISGPKKVNRINVVNGFLCFDQADEHHLVIDGIGILLGLHAILRGPVRAPASNALWRVAACAGAQLCVGSRVDECTGDDHGSHI